MRLGSESQQQVDKQVDGKASRNTTCSPTTSIIWERVMFHILLIGAIVAGAIEQSFHLTRPRVDTSTLTVAYRVTLLI